MAVPSSPRDASRDSLTEFVRRGELVAPDDAGIPSDDEDISDIRLVRRFARRRRGIRLLGALAVIGTLAGGTFVLQQPKVRREALAFVTLGHEDAAVRLGHRIAAIVETVRHR